MNGNFIFLKRVNICSIPLFYVIFTALGHIGRSREVSQSTDITE